MRTIRSSVVTILLIATSAFLAGNSARADSYTQTNLQSDISGVAAHTDPNLVNPWGITANLTGTVIWVSDNGTGASTLYHQDGTAVSLVVTIPTSARKMETSSPPNSFS